MFKPADNPGAILQLSENPEAILRLSDNPEASFQIAGIDVVLGVDNAAAVLEVGADTVTRWEQQFGCPRTIDLGGGRRIYARAELIALRTALANTSSVGAAIKSVRDPKAKHNQDRHRDQHRRAS